MALRPAKSKLWIPCAIEAKELFEIEMERAWEKYRVRCKDFNGSESEAIVTSLAAGDEFKPLTLGLLYGILTGNPGELDTKKRLMTALMWASSGGPSDAWNHILTNVNFITVEWWDRLNEGVRRNFVWLLDYAIGVSVPNIDDVLARMLRNLKGGDVSPLSVALSELLHDVMEKHVEWVKAQRKGVLIATIVSTSLRLLCDHQAPTLHALRAKEARLAATLLRERFVDCLPLGRELLRLLVGAGRSPELEPVLADLTHDPAALAPGFGGLAQLAEAKPNKRLVQSRLSVVLERELLFLLQKVRAGFAHRHISWVLAKHIGRSPEGGSLRADVIRWLCIIPENAGHADLVSRQQLVQAFLPNPINNPNVAEVQYCKLALFWDWLCFVPNSNPAVLETVYAVLWQSSKSQSPHLSASMLDFLARIPSELHPQLKDKIRLSVIAAFTVLPNATQLLESGRLDGRLKARLAATFPELLKGGVVDEPTPSSSKEAEALEILNAEDQMSGGAQFSDDDDANGKMEKSEDSSEDDKDEKPTPPPPSSSRRPAAKAEVKAAMSEEDEGFEAALESLDEGLRGVLLAMDSAEDPADRADHMQKLLLAFLDDEGDMHSDEAQIESLAVCLCSLLKADFGRRRLAPQNCADISALQDSLAAPIFALFRNLVLSPNDDASWDAIIRLVGEMHDRQSKVGYYLLYFLFASNECGERDGRGLVGDATAYRSLCDYLDKPVKTCLAQDLQLCANEDYRLFGFIIPFVFQSLKADAMSSPELMHLIVATLDPAQMRDMISAIVQGKLEFFKKDSFNEILKSSLEWESLEQLFLWDLVAAEGVPVDWVLPVFARIDEGRHAEAVSSTLLLLKRMEKEPNTGLLRSLLSRPLDAFEAPTPTLHLTTLALKVLIDEWEERMSELLAALLAKVKSKRPPSVGKGLSLELVLEHLDRLRKDCPSLINAADDNFFARRDVAAALWECREAGGAQFAELFAALELLESVRDSAAGSPRKSRSAAARQAGADADSDDDEHKGKPKRKKRKKVVESDSD